MLVGRESEHRALSGALRAVQEGTRGFFLLSGGAGIGKTTLLDAVAKEAEDAGIPAAAAAGWEAVDVPPFWIWDEVSRQLGLQRPSSDAPGRMSVFAAIANSLETAIDTPHALFFDDLHAADEDSLLALAHVVSAVRAPLLIVGAFDPVVLRRSPQREMAIGDLTRRAVSMPLSGLSRDDVRALMMHLAPDPPDEALTDAVLQATEGNPLFVEEVLRMFSARGEVHRGDHSIGFRVPVGVRGVVRSRAALLEPSTRELLMVASVIGKIFEVSLVQRVLSLDLYDVLERLEDAALAGFVEETSSLGLYAFSHILTREAFYEDLSTAQRMRLHHRVAMTLEEEPGEPSDKRVQELAHHWFKAAQAGDLGRALELSKRGAEAAAARRAYDEAERLYKRALQVADSAGTEVAIVEELQRALAQIEKTRAAAPAPLAATATPLAAAPHPQVFRRDGEFWTVRYGGRTSRLKDTKGMRYLRHLLSNPGREVHVLDLVAIIEHPERGAEVTSEDITSTGSDQPLLDEHAKRAYKQRLEDLQADIEEAEANHDPERVARLREEVDALIEQLSSAVGLGGRDRVTTSSAERARVNVRKVVKEALRRIEAADPDLGAHLAATVRTGIYLSYTPDPRISTVWTA